MNDIIHHQFIMFCQHITHSNTILHISVDHKLDLTLSLLA